MCKTDPIKNTEDIKRLKNYFLLRNQYRNYAMVTVALNTSLRIGDLLGLTWGDVYNAKTGKYREHIVLIEQKTGKRNIIALNKEAIQALKILQNTLDAVTPSEYIFKSRVGINQPIVRSYAFRIIKQAVLDLNLEGTISCHSLRKTFGYHAWKKGVPPALIMSIYNHSSIEITKRYLSIDQDDKDEVFLEMNL
ncbi:MAG TPA: tyrosine-type recombinase/integrase [Candidatus Blautia intestinavium]|nr:tyrosine-type recombinase/integrase [Candidatus Blautia intestinavium]HJC56207.1 tyrosine-type recombinase/integrase [Candidatus Eisenbergiella intestinipullorum]